MKKVLSIALAMIMVMALSIAVYADIDLAGEATYPANANITINIPEGVDVSNGATVTLKIKGTSDNTALRFYLTDANDGGRVTEVATVEIVDGAFDTTIDMVIDSTGAIQGAADPTIIMIKGPDYATPPANTTFEVLSVVGVDAPAPAEDAPAEDAPAADAPAADETPADTGIVLAVLPMAIAAAAVVVSKRK